MPVVGRVGALGCALDDLDFRLVFNPREKGFDRLDRAKGPGEFHLLRRRQILIPKEDHLVARQRVTQLGLRRRVQRLAQVQAMDHGTDVGCVRLHRKACVGRIEVVESGHGRSPAGGVKERVHSNAGRAHSERSIAHKHRRKINGDDAIRQDEGIGID